MGLASLKTEYFLIQNEFSYNHLLKEKQKLSLLKTILAQICFLNPTVNLGH